MFRSLGMRQTGLGNVVLLEIYRPIKEVEKETFYEFGALMPIIEDSVGVNVHAGTDVNQNSDTGVAASGVFTEGDVYHIYRTPSKVLDLIDPYQGVFHESQWWSDFYKSDEWDIGKSGVESNFNERYLKYYKTF